MKKLLTLAFMSILFTGCSTSAVPQQLTQQKAAKHTIVFMDVTLLKESATIIQTAVNSFDNESVGFAFTTSVSYLSSVQESMVNGKNTVTMGAESVEVGEKIYFTPTIMDNQKIKIKLDGTISYIEDILKMKNGTQFPMVRSCNVNIQALPLISSGESLLYPVCLLSNYKYYILISPRIEK